jgi:predicted hydrocarbon binding protein
MAENSILDQIAYDQIAGALRFKDVRYVLIRPETVVGFQKAIEKNSTTLAEDALFEGGFQGGYLSAKNYSAINDLDDSRLIDFMMKMGTEIGWGNFKLQAFDSRQERLGIMVEHSAFAGAYGRSSNAVCHLIRGVLSGLASALLNKKCVGSETRCLATGNGHCFFQIHAPGH